MAGNNTSRDQIVVPSRTYVFLAPLGTAVPADATTAPATGWYGVGYTPEDSLTFATEPTFQEVKSAQADYPVKRVQTGESATLSVDLQQWNGDNFKAAFGGGSITKIGTTAPFTYKYVPPKIGERKEIAAIVDVVYGSLHYRYVFPAVFQMEGVSQNLHKGAEARLPLKFAVLGSDAGDPWYVLTDDPSFAPPA